MRYPNFLGIGAQKAGTTWLHAMLVQHPGLWLPPVKELHYFDAMHCGPAGGKRRRLDPARAAIASRAIARMSKQPIDSAEKEGRLNLLRLLEARELTDEWYGQIFDFAPTGSICGEITPEYGLLPDVGIAHIIDLHPLMKFIFILRDPIDRSWSQLRMNQRRKRAKSPYDKNVLQALNTRGFFERSNYAETIQRYRKFVPGDRLLTIYFDDIVSLPAATIRTVYRHLGLEEHRVDSDHVLDSRNVGESEVLTPELHQTLKDILKPAYERLQRFDNPIVSKWIERHYGGPL